MIVVTGATGKLGRAVVEHLLARVPASEVAVSVRDVGKASEVAVSVRDVGKASDLAARGVEVRAGDFADPSGLTSAFRDASALLVVSVGVLGPEGARLYRNAVDAAVAAGVGRLFYTSHQAVSPRSAFAPMLTHADNERMIADSGLPFTALRNGFYADSGMRLLGDPFATGEIAMPADGPISWTTHDDLAEATAVALTTDIRPGDPLDGFAPPFTGGEAPTLEEVAEQLGATGTAVRRVLLSDDDYRDRLLARGVPAGGADMLLGMFRAARAGEFATVDPLLGELVGRRPGTLVDLLTDSAQRAA